MANFNVDKLQELLAMELTVREFKFILRNMKIDPDDIEYETEEGTDNDDDTVMNAWIK